MAGLAQKSSGTSVNFLGWTGCSIVPLDASGLDGLEFVVAAFVPRTPAAIGAAPLGGVVPFGCEDSEFLALSDGVSGVTSEDSLDETLAAALRPGELRADRLVG